MQRTIIFIVLSLLLTGNMMQAKVYRNFGAAYHTTDPYSKEEMASNILDDHSDEIAIMNDDFADVIKKAIAKGGTHVNIPKGRYYMKLKDGKPLILDGLKNVVIECNGSQIITKKASQAISIRNCTNITIKGLSIDCEQLPFTQGKIIAMDEKERLWWDLEIMDGYPLGSLLNEIPNRVQIFDPQTLCLKKNLYTYFAHTFKSVEQIKGRVFRFTKKKFNPDSNEAIGDYVVMSLNAGHVTRPHTIVLSKTKNVHLEDVTIYSGNCFGFFEDQCENNSYNKCVIDRKTDDEIVSCPRLRSVNADAFHSKGAVVGPKVTNCTFRYHGDDCIAINTSFYKVMSNRGTSVDIVCGTKDIKMRVGNMLRFVSYEGAIVGEVRVTKIESVSDFSQSDLDKVNEKFNFTVDKNKHMNVTRLTLERSVPIENGGVVSSLDMGGSGFIVKNNIVGHTRARGLLIKSSDGIIENNQIVGCELGGIVIAPELVWLEAGFSHNVKVENNRIVDCMFANSSYGIEQAAPLCVVAINAKDEVAPAGGFQNITVRNNIIENSPEPAMIFTSICGGLVEGNSVTISKDIIRNHGETHKIDQSGAIWTKNNKNLVVKDNTVK